MFISAFTDDKPLLSTHRTSYLYLELELDFATLAPPVDIVLIISYLLVGVTVHFCAVEILNFSSRKIVPERPIEHKGDNTHNNDDRVSVSIISSVTINSSILCSY